MTVVDASVVLAFLLPDEDGTLFESLTSASEEMCAPSLLDVEVTNTILTATRRNRFTPAAGSRIASTVADLPITRIPTSPASLSNAFAMAQQHALSLYDALYLSLAKTLALPLATHDRRLRAAAELEAVPVLP